MMVTRSHIWLALCRLDGEMVWGYTTLKGWTSAAGEPFSWLDIIINREYIYIYIKWTCAWCHIILIHSCSVIGICLCSCIISKILLFVYLYIPIHAWISVHPIMNFFQGLVSGGFCLNATAYRCIWYLCDSGHLFFIVLSGFHFLFRFGGLSFLGDVRAGALSDILFCLASRLMVEHLQNPFKSLSFPLNLNTYICTL